MKFAAATVVLASSALACLSPSEAGATCLTSGGSWLYMIAPFQDATLTVGQPFNIQWDSCGADLAFQNATLSFEIADATKSNNIQSIPNGQLTFSGPVTASMLQATAIVPNIPAGAKYAIKSSYHDVAGNKWDNCFGNTFSVVGGAAVAPAGNATVAPAGGAPKSGAVGSAGRVAAAGVVAAAFLF
ncbi:hypothetical protein HDU98_009190 [Podochytrium sp. JEL0797]|nr:hypothetical protein HDU98_009190 [Podochytrium sp. JEL0797]